jgi:hypothetical protein
MRRRSRSQAHQTQQQDPLSRKPLREMTPEERVHYYDDRRARLTDFSIYVQEWMQRRRDRRQHNYNDEQYEAFQELAADLVVALNELSEIEAANLPPENTQEP